MDELGMFLRQQQDALRDHLRLEDGPVRERFLEDREDRRGVVVGGDAIDGERAAILAFMDQHQLSAWA